MLGPCSYTQNPKCQTWACIWGSLYLEGHLGWFAGSYIRGTRIRDFTVHLTKKCRFYMKEVNLIIRRII